ncbi:MAG: hypothetical protein ACI4XW_04410 [Candidatus Spyradocola sp.]
MFYVFYDAVEAVLNGLSSWMGVGAVALLCVAGLTIFLLTRRLNRGGDRT